MKLICILIFLLAATLLPGCGTTTHVPITGRKQHLLVSDEQILGLSTQQYAEYMQSAKVSTNAAQTALVKRVGQRLATAVVSYLRQNGMADEVANYQWEFNLVQNQSVNAFCMPGGKIVVYEGILPVTGDEASLAVVLGHEIAHAVAKHSAERISNSYRQQYGMQILSGVAQASGVSADLQQLGAAALGIGAQAWSSGFSRSQESEADHIGLIFAAMAGYDPRVAIAFWQRMAQASGGGGTSIFSDHPSDAKRIKQIQGWMPEVLQYYKPGATTSSAGIPKSQKTLHISSKK